MARDSLRYPSSATWAGPHLLKAISPRRPRPHRDVARSRSVTHGRTRRYATSRRPIVDGVLGNVPRQEPPRLAGWRAALPSPSTSTPPASLVTLFPLGASLFDWPFFLSGYRDWRVPAMLLTYRTIGYRLSARIPIGRGSRHAPLPRTVARAQLRLICSVKTSIASIPPESSSRGPHTPHHPLYSLSSRNGARSFFIGVARRRRHP